MGSYAAGSAGEWTSGALHRVWATLKDALTGDDPHAILAAAEQAEDRTLRQYDETLGDAIADDLRFLVERQRAGVQSAHERVHRLRDQHS